MPKPFDATLKGLLEVAPADWAILAGQPADDVRVIDADLSTFSGGADKVLRVGGRYARIVHFDFQSGPDRSLPRRVHLYNAWLEDRHHLPVHSVVIMLRPRAELSNLTGIYQRECEGEPPYLIFRYQMIRVWQLPVERLLQGGVGTLPLAAISAVSNAELPDVIERMRDRLRKRPTAQVKDLWTATYLLMGLRYERDFVNQLLEGVISMEGSTTYQAILEKGIAKGKDVGAREELRKVLLLLGQDRFGPA